MLHDYLFPNTFSEHLPRHDMKWSIYNQSLVRQGELLLAFDAINNWDRELKEMNKDKVGEPFQYLIHFSFYWDMPRVYFHLAYIQTEGIAQGHAKGKVHIYPRLYDNK